MQSRQQQLPNKFKKYLKIIKASNSLKWTKLGQTVLKKRKYYKFLIDVRDKADDNYCMNIENKKLKKNFQFPWRFSAFSIFLAERKKRRKIDKFAHLDTLRLYKKLTSSIRS